MEYDWRTEIPFVICDEFSEIQDIDYEENLNKAIGAVSEGNKTLNVLSLLFRSEPPEEKNVDNTKMLKEKMSNESKFVHYESQEIEKFKIKKTNNLRKK